MLYMLIDGASPSHTAVVEVIRNLVTGDKVEWKLRTPGAFGGLAVNDDDSYPANAVAAATPLVHFYVVYPDGTPRNCFQLYNYFWRHTKFAHDDGIGHIFANVGGRLQAGLMTWKKL
jgi:hypothetical protein